MKNGDNWQIPLASGIGGFVGSWISLLIPHPTVGMTVLSLSTGIFVGWLVGFLAYKPRKWIPQKFSLSCLNRVVVWFVVPLLPIMSCHKTLQLINIFDEDVNGATFWLVFIFLTGISYALFQGAFNLVREIIYKEAKFEEGRSYLFLPEITLLVLESKSIPANQAPRVLINMLKSTLAGIVVAWLYAICLVLLKITLALFLLPIWIYQTIKLLNCEQRLATGFGGIVGTIIGFFFKAPQWGFGAGVIAGWFGWYVLRLLPGVSVVKINKVAMEFLTKTLARAFPATPIPEF